MYMLRGAPGALHSSPLKQRWLQHSRAVKMAPASGKQNTRVSGNGILEVARGLGLEDGEDSFPKAPTHPNLGGRVSKFCYVMVVLPRI